MKTFKYKHVGLMLLLLLLLSSCEDFLDKNPTYVLSSEAFWKTEADAKMALAGCYDALYFLPPGGAWSQPYLDCLSDNAYAQWASYQWNMGTIVTGDLTPTTSQFSPNIYKYCYKGIAVFNFFLDNIGKVESIDSSTKNEYIGQVKFLRALFYFHLVEFYGDIILFKESLKSAEEGLVAKSPQKDVLAFIKEDLDFAIANLPNTAYSGHAVKGSAMGLKARVLLYEQNWVDAAALAKQIMDGGKFSLADDYHNIFINAGQKNNPEIMFSCVYLAPDLFQWQSSEIAGGSMNTEFGWGSHICPYWDLVDAYECIDGKSITESTLYDPTQKWLNRDPRLAYTIRMPNIEWPAGEPNGAVSPTGINMEKYVDLSQAPFSHSRFNEYDQDYVIIRYADVLLMYAEAKNEASGPDASIYDALDQVRGRAGVNMPNVDRGKYNTKELLRDYIRNERRIELALEGQRYFDLKRWHIAHIVLPKLKTPGGIPLVFQEKNYFIPFPQSEIDINPNLIQNSGY